MSTNKSSSLSINKTQYMVVTLLPVFIVLALGLSFIFVVNDDLEFVENELSVIGDTHTIYESAYTLQKIRGLGYQLLHGNNKVRPRIEDLQLQFENLLLHDDPEDIHQFQSHRKIDEILRKGKKLYKSQFTQGADAELMFENYTALIFDHFITMRHLARDFGLLLDHELETYTLMDLVINRLPRVTELIGRLRGRSGGLSNRTMTLLQVEENAILIEASLNRLREDMSVLSNSNLQLQIIEVESHIRRYLNNIKVVLKQPDLQDINLRINLFDEGTKVLEKINSVHEKTNLYLEQLLQQRYSSLYQTFVLTIIAIVTALFFLFFFIYRVYLLNQRAVLAEQESLKALEISQQSLNRFKTTLDEAMDCVFMFEPDSLKFFYVNAGAIEQVGYSHDEMMNMTAIDIKPEFDEQRFRETIAPMIAGEKPIINFETIHKHKDGHTIPVEIFLQYIHTKNESPRFVAFVRDVTDRVEKDRLLADSAERQRSILENIVDGLITINEVGIIESFNPAAVKIFGYQTDEVLGKNIKMLMPDPYHSEHDGYLDNYHQTGTKKIIGIGREVEGLRKDGSTFPMELAVSEMMVQGEKLFTGIVRDITDRKQMDKMKNEFISTVSHELRTPLTAIRGALGLLTSGTVGELPDSANEMLTVASNNTARLLLLINDILDIQKIESGKMNFRFESLDVNVFLEQAITDFAEYGTQHGVKFVLGKSLEKAKVFADKDRLMQVMGNLLSNAAKFSPNDENVDISIAKHQGNRLRISVTDYGDGIPEEFQPELFERFTQSDSSDTRAKGGTGLGLSITKVITEKHGGRIGFVSKEGIGSTFYIELPELVDGVDTTESAIMPLDENHKACVLIVEDDPDVAALIRRMLAEAGFNSDIAYDAGQARQLLKERKNYYRLMTLDIILPDEDGISLLTSLRKEAETQRLPVVVLSVKADEAKRELEGGALDVADWLGKPIDSQRLVDVVANVVATNQPPRVLHVEDEKDVHTVVNQMLKGHCELLWTTTLAESREIIKKNNIDLVLLDIGLPDGSGLDLIEDIEQLSPQPQVVIFSALDVSDEYADRVDAVLVKSKTNNKKLLSVLLGAMK